MYTTTIFVGDQVNVSLYDQNGAHDPITIPCPVTSVTTREISYQQGVAYHVPTHLTVDLAYTGLAGKLIFTLEDLDPDVVNGTPTHVNLFYNAKMVVQVMGVRCNLMCELHLKLLPA